MNHSTAMLRMVRMVANRDEGGIGKPTKWMTLARRRMTTTKKRLARSVLYHLFEFTNLLLLTLTWPVLQIREGFIDDESEGDADEDGEEARKRRRKRRRAEREEDAQLDEEDFDLIGESLPDYKVQAQVR
jgi:hypothetical protein